MRRSACGDVAVVTDGHGGRHRPLPGARRGRGAHVRYRRCAGVCRAPDAGMTAIEAAVDVVIVGVLMSAMASLVLLSMDAFTSVKDVGNEPGHVTQGKLSRAAARMLADERCGNPALEEARSRCLERDSAPFPQPYAPPAWSGYPQTPEFTVCWMVEAEKLEARPVDTAVTNPDDITKTYTYLNPDERDLECWYHEDPAAGGVGRLLAAMHYPYEPGSYGATAQDQDSSDLFVPSWSVEPYRVSLIATKVGGFGSGGSGSQLKGWRCVEGAFLDPESVVGSSTTTIPRRNEKGCRDGIWAYADSPGAAVLSVNLCVLMSHDELKRRRSLARLNTARGETTAATACTGVPACAPAKGDTVEICEPVEGDGVTRSRVIDVW